jgi:outer membrane protein
MPPARTTVAFVVATVLLVPAGCVRRRDFLLPAPPVPLSVRSAGVQPAPPAGPLTMDDAVRLALERNPDLGAARARVDEARARLAESAAVFWPRLSAEASYLHGNAPSAYLFKRIDARRLPPGVDFNDPGSFDNFEGGLGLSWNLFNGGRDVLGRWSADANAAMSELARNAAKNELVATVVAIYLEARGARELLAADDATVRTVESQVAESRVRVEGGGALRADLLSLEVRLAEAREMRLRSDTAYRLSVAALREILALPDDAAIELTRGDTPTAALPATSAEALAEAYRLRPEAAMARRAVERARIDLSSARRAYLPRVDLLSRFYADVPDLHTSVKDPNYTVAVALSVDLFDGGSRAAAIDRAHAVLHELGEADRKTLLAIARDVESAYLRLGEARARDRVATQAVGAADESFQLVAVQYRGGAATVTRYLEAEGGRARAHSAKIRAQLDVERASVDVQRAIGVLARQEGDTP